MEKEPENYSSEVEDFNTNYYDEDDWENYDSSDSSSKEEPKRNFCDVHEENIIKEKRTRGMNKSYLLKLKTVESLKPPKSYKHIKGRPDADIWYEAYQKEINAIEEIGGMTVTDQPIESKEVIDILELFSWKHNHFSGEKEAKVRIVARGDKIDVKLALYSPVAGIVGLRIVVHCKMNYFENENIRARDAKTAFLYSRKEKPDFFKLPRGHKLRKEFLNNSLRKKKFMKVWKAYCALYGMPDASFHWFTCLSKFLLEIGLKRCFSENCLFMLRDKGGKGRLLLLVLIYVDDILFIGNNCYMN